jgi:hypothetical protein
MGRRLSKTISNQGLWAVPGSTVDGAEPLPSGDRVEHYYCDGWELVERRGPGSSGNGEGRPATGQWVYGVTRIDEPLRYDRNTGPSSDGTGAADDCVEVRGGAAEATAFLGFGGGTARRAVAHRRCHPPFTMW